MGLALNRVSVARWNMQAPRIDSKKPMRLNCFATGSAMSCLPSFLTNDH